MGLPQGNAAVKSLAKHSIARSDTSRTISMGQLKQNFIIGVQYRSKPSNSRAGSCQLLIIILEVCNGVARCRANSMASDAPLITYPGSGRASGIPNNLGIA